MLTQTNIIKIAQLFASRKSRTMPVLKQVACTPENTRATTLDIYCTLPPIAVAPGCYSPEKLALIGKTAIIPDTELDQFPLIPTYGENHHARELNVDVLVEQLKRCLPFTSTDNARHNLMGIHVNREHLVSTNGHIVHYETTDILPTDSPSIIIPTAFCVALIKASKLLPGKHAKLIIADDKLWLYYDSNVILGCRLLDSQYPDYKQVIPTGSPSHNVVLAYGALKALTALKPKRIDEYTFDTVTLHKDGQCNFKSAALQLKIPLNFILESPVLSANYCYCASYLLTALQNTLNTTLHLHDPMGPLLIGDLSCASIVMPCKMEK